MKTKMQCLMEKAISTSTSTQSVTITMVQPQPVTTRDWATMSVPEEQLQVRRILRALHHHKLPLPLSSRINSLIHSKVVPLLSKRQKLKLNHKPSSNPQ